MFRVDFRKYLRSFIVNKCLVAIISEYSLNFQLGLIFLFPIKFELVGLYEGHKSKIESIQPKLINPIHLLYTVYFSHIVLRRFF